MSSSENVPGDGCENEEDDDELQLHDDDKSMPERKRHRSNDAITKIEAVAWAREFSIRSAARKFRVVPKRIREWKKQQDNLNRQVYVPIFIY